MGLYISRFLKSDCDRFIFFSLSFYLGSGGGGVCVCKFIKLDKFFIIPGILPTAVHITG